MRRQRLHAFTLFEVMISMLIMTTAIISTVALLPIGLRAQQLARSQMFAASEAVSLMYEFHNQIPTFEGVSRLAPAYTGVPGTSTTDPTQPAYLGWAEQLREQSVHASAYQANAEQSLCGWMNGVLPLPPEIGHRLDSDNDEIQQLLDQGAMIFYPDPNFMMGLNQGASADKTMQITPAPEIQKLIFAFTGYPQQNALSSFPVDSYPYYENYPFPPAWLSLQAHGRETRLLQFTEWSTSSLGRGSNYGGRTGIPLSGRETNDWSWEEGYFEMDDAGHAQYLPVTWGMPMRPGQDVPSWCSTKALDDPNSSDQWYKVDANNSAFYEGNGNYQGRNWRYFATSSGFGGASTLWCQGNGQAPYNDPYYSLTDPATSQPYKQEWAYFCFQRLSGVNADYVGYPASAYTNASQLNNTAVAGITVNQVVSDSNPPPATSTTTVSVPSQTFASHPPAAFHRAGWLPIRGLLTNPDFATYEGLEGLDPHAWDNGQGSQAWAPSSWTGTDSAVNWGSLNGANTQGAYMWNVGQDAGIPHTCQPTATYEMRANYRDRAIDLWQAVMPTHSNLAQLIKNPVQTPYSNPFYQGSGQMPGESNALSPTYIGSLVEESVGGTMVDCCKYEYPPMELDRFQFILPSQLVASDWPIHPAQIMALSYLAHAAMMVTGYAPPFAQQLPQGGNQAQELEKISWEALNWTYQATPEEVQMNLLSGAAHPPYPQVPATQMQVGPAAVGKAQQNGYNGTGAQPAIYQGIFKDAMVAMANAAPGATYIDLCNTSAYDWVVYPGDELVLEPSYYQWYYRFDRSAMPAQFGVWSQGDPHDVAPGPDDGWGQQLAYDPDTNDSYPNLNYRMQTFRVTQVQMLSAPGVVSGPVYTLSGAPPQTAPASAPPGPNTAAFPPAIHPTNAPVLSNSYMGYPYGGYTPWSGQGVQSQPATGFVAGIPGMRVWLSAPLPAYPKTIYDAHINPGSVGSGWDSWSLHQGALVRRICGPSDIAFARKVYEMCIQWAAAYSAEFPNDFGAPRMANHPTMMDQPLALFDLFWDAANGGLPGAAVRTPQHPLTTAGAMPNESFYRWLVPNNWVPQTWFYGQQTTDVGQHDNSHLAPGWARNAYFDQMVHNTFQTPPGASTNYDQVHLWLTKPFSPFERARTIKFWSVDWKSYQDAEMVPSAPVDFAKHNRYPRYDYTLLGYSGIAPNGDYGYATGDLGDGHSPLCGLPESLYVWTSAARDQRYGDVVGGERAGYLYQNWNSSLQTPMVYNSSVEPVVTGGGHVTADIHLGHWGADRNGNGKLDIGPVPPATRMRAVTVGQFLYYDPVLRLNLSN